MILKTNLKLFKKFLRFYTSSGSNNQLLQHLLAKIKFSGPVTLHEYMKEVLTNPKSGYYMNKNVFGKDGDFVTSPEISQMFGELIGVWIINEWQKMGAPKPFQLIEFGPGSGVLMQDILRTFDRLKLEKNALEVHLIEKSVFLSNVQETRICESREENITQSTTDLLSPYKSNFTSNGVPVKWHHHIQDVPQRFSMVIAHEFFDALPIHKLNRTENGWREVLIDLESEILESKSDISEPKHQVSKSKSESKLRYVLSRFETPATKLYVDKNEIRDTLEISPESGIIMQELSSRLESHGGAALIVDYGHNGESADTFRAYRNHKQVHPLINPGDCDLTADVDFSYLRKNVEDKCVVYGPVTQAFFLKNMAIELRLKNLLQHATREQSKNIINSYNMLIAPKQMGHRFKAFAILPKVMEKILKQNPPAGFFWSFGEADKIDTEER